MRLEPTTPPKELPPDSRVAVYRLYDDKGDLLYVGVSNKPKTRWREHRKTKSWWPQVSRRDVEWFPTRAQALEAERKAIEAELPQFNAMHHPVNWPAVIERGRRQEQARIESARQQITIADHLGDQLTPEQVRKIVTIFQFHKPREDRRHA